MSKTQLLTTLLVLVMLVTSQAQEKFIGNVTDTLGKPIELANVIAYKTNGAVESLGVTDHSGRFTLFVEPDSTYTLKCSFIGYETYSTTITASQESQPFSIELKEAAKTLKEVEIVSEFPVVITGDTISYKADAFTDGNERKLEDVLEDLPGFEVDENGQIKVQGKSVEKVLVEGKEFFDGDSKLATKNIPANAVDKVQLLRNYNDVAPLDNLNSKERLALNIKLKEGKKNMVFGDLEAGAGDQQRYLAHANTFYYSPKLNLNFIADANNIGQPAFDSRDYFRMMGGFSRLSSSSGSNIRLSNEDLGFATATSRSAENINSTLGALNFTYTPNKKLRLSGLAIAARSLTDFRTTSNRSFLGAQSVTNESLETNTAQKMKSGLAKFSLAYTPRPAVHVASATSLKFSNMNRNNVQRSVFGAEENDITSQESQRPLSINQQANLYLSLNEKNVISVEGSLAYKNQDPLLDLDASDVLFAGIIPQQTEGTSLTQQQETTTLQSEIAMNYYRILNLTNHINFFGGITNSNQNFESGLFSGSNFALINDINYNLTDIYGGIGYKTKQGNFVLYPRLVLHRYLLDLSGEASVEDFVFTPQLNLTYDIRSSQSIDLSYELNAQYFDVTKFAQELVIENYNLARRGNPNLTNGLYHSLSLSYRNFSMFNFFNLYGGISYNRQLNDQSDRVLFDQNNRILSAFNLPVTNQSLSGYGNFSKTFRMFKINGGVDFLWSNFYNDVETLLTENESFTQHYEGGFQTELFKALTLGLSYDAWINDYQSPQASNVYITHKPSVSLGLEFLKLFTLEMEYEYFDYRSQDGAVATNYDFLTTKLIVQKDKSPWQFRVQGLNALKTNAIRRDGFSSNLISTTSQFVQPFYWTVSVFYDL